MLVVQHLRKKFESPDLQSVVAVNDVNLTVSTGKLFTLLGPSGCGKTTIMRCIAGLERPDRGRISIRDRVVFDSKEGVFVPPEKRGIGMVFQSYAIWPHMDVFGNIAYPLRVSRKRKYKSSEIATRVERALQTVDLAGFGKRPASQLSGGQQQRLAFARALVDEPDLILLDEPLSNLDAKLRKSMCFELKRLQRELGITMIYVTHDQAEALALSNEIAVMRSGSLIQQGSPRDIYGRPNSRFIADFVGSINFIPGKMRDGGGSDATCAVETGIGMFHCTAMSDIAADADVLVAIRPENIKLSDDMKLTGTNVFEGTVSNKVFLGDEIDYVVTVGNTALQVKTHPDVDIKTDAATKIAVSPQKCFVILDRESENPA